MTIGEILKELSDKIKEYIQLGITIELANIATLSDDDSIVSDRSAIVLSIVNIEEDKTLKNQSLYKAIPKPPE